eukprot:gene64068-87623_t
MSGAWTVLDRTEILTVAPYLTVARERVRIASGAVIDDFYQVELATFALCVPQLPSGEIVTLWEYKHGARRFGLGFPAGFVEAGEAADAAGARALTEETGFPPSAEAGAVGQLRRAAALVVPGLTEQGGEAGGEEIDGDAGDDLVAAPGD